MVQAVLWVLAGVLALIGLCVVGLVVAGQFFPKESRGTFLHDPKPPVPSTPKRRPGTNQWRP